MEEKWKDIKGYEGFYRISTKGRVKSLDRVINRCDGTKQTIRSRILKQHLNTTGCYCVDLIIKMKRKNCKVHRLVAQAFIQNPENKPQVNHMDGDRTNNDVSNLEWATNQENRDHAIENGLHLTGEVCSKAGLKDSDVLDMRNAYKLGCFTYGEISEAYDISISQVSHIINKNQWAHL